MYKIRRGEMCVCVQEWILSSDLFLFSAAFVFALSPLSVYYFQITM